MLPNDHGEPIDIDGREEEHSIQRDAERVQRRGRKLGPFDAVYLDLHGAMVAENTEDGEGQVDRAKIRELLEKIADQTALASQVLDHLRTMVKRREAHEVEIDLSQLLVDPCDERRTLCGIGSRIFLRRHLTLDVVDLHGAGVLQAHRPLCDVNVMRAEVGDHAAGEVVVVPPVEDRKSVV